MKSEIGKNALTSFLATPTYTILTVIKFCEKLVNLLKQLFLVLWSFLLFIHKYHEWFDWVLFNFQIYCWRN